MLIHVSWWYRKKKNLKDTRAFLYMNCKRTAPMLAHSHLTKKQKTKNIKVLFFVVDFVITTVVIFFSHLQHRLFFLVGWLTWLWYLNAHGSLSAH